MPMFANLLERQPMTTRTEQVSSFEPKVNPIAPKKSFRSINKIPRLPNSLDCHVQKFSCLNKDQSPSALTLERKLKRKSFFEQVCGRKASNIEPDAHKPITSSQGNLIQLGKREFAWNSKPGARNIRPFADKAGFEGAYGSTSTVDSSDLSIDQVIRGNSKHKTSAFLNLNIKKTRLVTKTNKKFEFLPLVDRRSTKKANHPEKQSKCVFLGSGPGSEITELVNDVSKWDGKWADIDEAALKEVFFKA